MTDYKNELEQIRNRIFDLAYDHETEKRIASETASIMQEIEALLSKRELEALRWVASEGSKTNHCDDREYQIEKIKVDNRINQLGGQDE